LGLGRDLLDGGGDLGDQLADLAGGVLGFFGQLAGLFGHDGEAAALLAGAGGLDGGVEGEQVGQVVSTVGMAPSRSQELARVSPVYFSPHPPA
jgi:hypothetical protein